MPEYNSNGAILWEGKSALDGAPIMLIATGLDSDSSNSKTGALVQTWILRSDMKPTHAAHTGDDASICGDCPHRGIIVNGKNEKRSCYVTLFQAPLNIYGTAKRGRYARVKGDKARALLAGRNVRMGAYGDPAAVPFHVWNRILADAARGTGYTHQWRTCDQRFSRYCMASADTALDGELARAMGWRTFRVVNAMADGRKGEILCPASEQAGKRTTCAACLLCGGNSVRAKSVFIPVHGSKAVQNNARKRGVIA